MMLLNLMYEFFKTGLFSIGGGLATLPFLYEMSSRHPEWFTTADIADMIAISESTPGPIGINMSTYAGFQVAGIPGGILASLALAAPCVIIILIIARFLAKFRQNQWVEGALYGLRPASIAMISSAGLNVAKIALVNMQVLAEQAGFGTIMTQFFNWKAIALAAAVFIGVRKLKWNPVIFIAISAVVGILFQF